MPGSRCTLRSLAGTAQEVPDPSCGRGEVSDYVLMEQRGFGFVTFTDPAHAQAFLEVSSRQPCAALAQPQPPMQRRLAG